jgi:TPR repeat protein
MNHKKLNLTTDELCSLASKSEDDGDLEKAIELYLKAAKLGDSVAQLNLGVILEDKISPPQVKEAIYWTKRAIRSGHATGAWNLAMRYRLLGNKRWYIFWLNKAAEMGEVEAFEELKTLSWWHSRSKK